MRGSPDHTAYDLPITFHGAEERLGAYGAGVPTGISQTQVEIVLVLPFQQPRLSPLEKGSRARMSD